MSRGMLLWQSVLVGVQIMAGGAVLGDFIAGRWIGLLVLTVGALQAATTYFQRGLGIDPNGMPPGSAWAPRPRHTRES
jgi:hypothetical protein